MITTKFYLDTRKTAPGKSALLKISITKDRTVSYLSTGIRLLPSDWDAGALKAKSAAVQVSAELPAWKKRYVDFFEVSFLLIGMNTEDLVHVTGIEDGRLEYRRAKTGRPYSIKVEPECLEVIGRLRGKDWLLNPLDTYSCTHHWTSKVDNVLKEVAAELGLPGFSMYWARHSWATIAAELEIPRETIAAAMGHSGGTVTDIYINFDRSKIDRANRQVIDYVLYGKRQQTVQDILSRSFEELRKQIAGNAG